MSIAASMSFRLRDNRAPPNERFSPSGIRLPAHAGPISEISLLRTFAASWSPRDFEALSFTAARRLWTTEHLADRVEPRDTRRHPPRSAAPACEMHDQGLAHGGIDTAIANHLRCWGSEFRRQQGHPDRSAPPARGLSRCFQSCGAAGLAIHVVFAGKRFVSAGSLGQSWFSLISRRRTVRHHVTHAIDPATQLRVHRRLRRCTLIFNAARARRSRSVSRRRHRQIPRRRPGLTPRHPSSPLGLRARLQTRPDRPTHRRRQLHTAIAPASHHIKDHPPSTALSC